jgi:ABC-type siderophore export system fused ATPase/permease subunit
LSVKRGEVIFIVGGNGSGKSTLAKLLTALYQRTSGEVQLNGEAVTVHNSDELRHCFSAIFANFFLFTDVLDEWAADQYPVFREVFYREILPEFKQAGKTVIAVSHDDHYFDAADRVYKLDCGVMDAFDNEVGGIFGERKKQGPQLMQVG